MKFNKWNNGHWIKSIMMNYEQIIISKHSIATRRWVFLLLIFFSSVFFFIRLALVLTYRFTSVISNAKEKKIIGNVFNQKIRCFFVPHCRPCRFTTEARKKKSSEVENINVCNGQSEEIYVLKLAFFFVRSSPTFSNFHSFLFAATLRIASKKKKKKEAWTACNGRFALLVLFIFFYFIHSKYFSHLCFAIFFFIFFRFHFIKIFIFQPMVWLLALFYKNFYLKSFQFFCCCYFSSLPPTTCVYNVVERNSHC